MWFSTAAGINRYLITLALLCLPAVAGKGGDPVHLVVDGQPQATVILYEDAPPYTRKATALLVEYLERMSGARVPVADGPEGVGTSCRIWVGSHPALAQAFPTEDFSLKYPEEILIRTVGGDLVVIGMDEMAEDRQIQAGTYLAVVTFLQDYLGVRWLWPGELGTDVPQKATVSLGDIHHRYHPQLRYRVLRVANYRRYQRGMRGHESLLPGIDLRGDWVAEMDDQVRQWLHHHRADHNPHGMSFSPIRGSLPFWGGHAFPTWYERFAQPHPDWFALQPNGERVSRQQPPFPNQRDVKLCVSNPEVAEQWLQDAVERVRNSPRDTVVVSASPNDRGYMGYCVCSDCRAWDNPDAPILEQPLIWRDLREEHRALTDRYVRFWNILARGLRERLPDHNAYVGVWAYHAYRPPPVGVELEDNIIVGYVGIRRRNPLHNSLERMQEQRELWKGWSDRTAGGLIWRPNLMNRTLGMPYVFFRRHADNMRWLAENGMVGINVDSFQNHWATQGPQYYLTAMLSWNPYANGDAIMADYFERGFGPAAKAVEAYFRLFEEHYHWLAENIDSWHFRRDIAPAFRDFRKLPTSALDQRLAFGYDGVEHPIETRAEALLQQAREQVKDAPPHFLERVEFIARGFEYFVAHLDAVEAMNDLESSRVDPQIARERARQADRRRHDLLAADAQDFALSSLYLLPVLAERPEEFGPPKSTDR